MFGRRRSSLSAIPLLLGLCWAFPSVGVEAQSVQKWRVDSAPAVRIGGSESPEEDFLINPLSACLQENGTMVLQNSTRNFLEIRFHDSAGRRVRTVGRWGEGPFEFHYLLGVFLLEGDSLLAVGADDRFAVFGPQGEGIEAGRMGLHGALPVIWGEMVDRGHLATIRPLPPLNRPSSGSFRETSEVLLHDLDSKTTEVVARLLGQALSVESTASGVRAFPAPFGPESYFAGGGGMLWIGDSAEPIVRGFRPGKEEPEIEIRLPFEPRQVTRTDRGELRTAMEGLYSGDRRREWDRFAQSMDFPEYLPFFGGLKVDRLSNLWVQHYEVIGSDGPQMWEVFSQEGVHLATVEIPAPALSHCARRAPSGCGLSRGILEIGDDYLLVAQKDDLGVYTVGKFRLSKAL